MNRIIWLSILHKD